MTGAIDRPRMTWRDVEHLTPEHREWLMRLCDATAKECKTRGEAAKLIGVSLEELDKWLHFLTCRVSWPPRFDSGVFQKPVKSEPVKQAPEVVWQDELIPIEESDELRKQVAAWMNQYGVPMSGVPYACKASARRVTAFLQGDCCDAYVAAALRAMLGIVPRPVRKWEEQRVDVRDERRKREAELLELERQKYGLKRKAKPLSSMPV